MEYGILVVLIIMLLAAFVIVQETFAQLHWRKLVAEGDVIAIRELIETEAEHWRTSRVPKGTPALLWHGVQTVELLDVTADSARLSCNAEGEYALTGGRRVETSSPLAEGMKITKKLAEMALYDVPNVKLDRVQIDVYTSFRGDDVELVDWEEITPADFTTLTQGLFAPDSDGGLHAVEPIPWEQEPARST
jgi:hypothetical protein